MGDSIRRARHAIRNFRRDGTQQALLPFNEREVDGTGFDTENQNGQGRSGTTLWRTAKNRFFAANRMNEYRKEFGPTFSFTAPDEAGPAVGFFAPWNDLKTIARGIASSYTSVLLVCVPLGIMAELMHWSPVWVFTFNFFALIPLALLLGEVTEDLALRFGDIIGGLLNATFGNVVEMILSIAALLKGLNSVVAMSLLGSILSNLLLVLGCCFLLGGYKYREQTFNALANKTSCSLLLLSCIALAIPTASDWIYSGRVLPPQAVLRLSRGTAIVLAIVYCCYLFFQLKTHRDYFTGEESEKRPSLSLSGSLIMLLGITVIVAVCSEYLTGAIEAVSKKSGLSPDFLGLIVLPIAGNACEHITAVFVAVKDNMDLAIGIALGSSIQIAIFAIPISVLVGWMTGHHFSLSFDPFATIVLTMSVVHAYFVSSDARSNWLMGLQLVGTYVLIGMVFFFVDTSSQS